MFPLQRMTSPVVSSSQSRHGRMTSSRALAQRGSLQTHHSNRYDVDIRSHNSSEAAFIVRVLCESLSTPIRQAPSLGLVEGGQMQM